MTLLLAVLVAYVPCYGTETRTPCRRECPSELGPDHLGRVVYGDIVTCSDGTCQWVPVWWHRDWLRIGDLRQFAATQNSAQYWRE